MISYAAKHDLKDIRAIAVHMAENAPEYFVIIPDPDVPGSFITVCTLKTWRDTLGSILEATKE